MCPAWAGEAGATSDVTAGSYNLTESEAGIFHQYTSCGTSLSVQGHTEITFWRSLPIGASLSILPTIQQMAQWALAPPELSPGR